MAAFLKIYIEVFLLNGKVNWLETCLVIRWAIQGHLGPLVSGYPLTHCRLNRLPHTYIGRVQFKNSSYEIFLEKIAKLFSNSGGPAQMPHSAASDLGLHCLPVTHLGVFWLQWANIEICHCHVWLDIVFVLWSLHYVGLLKDPDCTAPDLSFFTACMCIVILIPQVIFLFFFFFFFFESQWIFSHH